MRFRVDRWIDEAGAPLDEAGADGGITVRGIASAQNLPTDPQTLLSMMRPDIQATVRNAQSVVGDLSPAISLVGTIVSGGVPSEAAVTAALAGAASFLGGPLAGAAMATATAIITGAEAVMRAFFDALGLYDHPINVSMCGLIPTGSIPYPADPNWVHLDTPTRFRTFLFGPAMGQAAFRSGNVALTWGSNPADHRKATNQTTWLYESISILHPSDPAAMPHPSDGRLFDFYFAQLLAKDLENWANCNPYVPPRQLLLAAQQAWNGVHSASATRVYPPMNAYAPGAPPLTQISMVSQILGEQGDPDNGTRNPPLTIHEGPVSTGYHGALTSHRASSGPSSPATTVAVVGLGTLGAIALFKPKLLSSMLRRVGIHL